MLKLGPKRKTWGEVCRVRKQECTARLQICKHHDRFWKYPEGTLIIPWKSYKMTAVGQHGLHTNKKMQKAGPAIAILYNLYICQ